MSFASSLSRLIQDLIESEENVFLIFFFDFDKLLYPYTTTILNNIKNRGSFGGPSAYKLPTMLWPRAREVSGEGY